MNIIRTIAATILVLSPLAAFGHGGGEHFRGTVKAVDDKALTVQSKDKKEVKISIMPDTKFEKSGAAAKVKDLAVGERVVVHTAKNEKPGEHKAVLVKFGAPSADVKHGKADGQHAGHGAAPR